MSTKRKLPLEHTVLAEDDCYIECDPTTQIEIHINPDQEELRTIIKQFDDEAVEPSSSPEDTVLENVTALREKLAVEHQEPQLSDFVDHRSAPQLYNYASSPNFPPLASPLEQPESYYQHYTELMAMVRSYEKMLGDDHDLGVSLQHYPELKQIRLLSVSVFGSGSVILLGMGKDQMPINVFEKISQLSLAIVPMKRPRSKSPRTEVSFFFHDKND